MSINEVYAEDESPCSGCKKRAALFTALGVLAGVGIGFAAFKLVKRGR